MAPTTDRPEFKQKPTAAKRQPQKPSDDHSHTQHVLFRAHIAHA